MLQYHRYISHTAYEFPNFYVEQYLSDLPIPVCPWRSVQNAPNAFVMESFMDELAYAAGKDPVAFRLQLLKNNMRARRVLETVAEKAGWGKAHAKRKGPRHCPALLFWILCRPGGGCIRE